MRLVDHRAIPSARHYNDIVHALGKTTKVQCGLSSDDTPPTIGHALVFAPYWTWDQITCSDAGWMPKREPYTYETINGASIANIYGKASELRREANEYVYNFGVLDPGNNGMDLRSMPTGDCTYSGGDPDSDIATWAVGHVRYYDGTTTQTYDLAGSSLHYKIFYTHDPCLEGRPEAVFGGAHNECRADTFVNSGLCGGGYWSFWWDTPYYAGPAGPIYAYGPAGEGHYDRLGASVITSFSSNYVGAVASMGLDETVEPAQTYYIGDAAATITGTGTPIGFDTPLKNLPDGATIVDARLEVRSTGLTRTWWSNTQDSYSDPYVYTFGTTQEGVGLVLLGRSIGTDGTEQWTPLGGCLGGTVSNGLWQVVDATALFQRLLALRNSTYCGFAIMPGLASQYVGLTDARTILRGMCSSIDYAVYLDPTWEGSYFGGADAVYHTGNSGEYVTWTDLEVGQAVVTFRLSSGQLGRWYLYGNMVRMDNP